MPSKDFLSNHQIVPAFVPVADAFAGGINTEVVSLRDYRRATLIIQTGAIEDANISNIVTIIASTSATASGTDMAFVQRAQQYSTSVDLWTSTTASVATGFNFATNNAVANAVWFAEVTAAEVQAALAGADFVFAAIAETANKTITASGIWILSEPRYPQDVPLTAIV